MPLDTPNELPLPKEASPSSAPQQPVVSDAADLIRQKIAEAYGQEPAASEELAEIEHSGSHSKHQKFIEELTNSGKSLAEIQTAWHSYYASLPDAEKHDVWQEFYANHARASKLLTINQAAVQNQTTAAQKSSAKATPSLKPKKAVSGDVAADPPAPKTMGELHDKIVSKVSARGKLKTSHHLQSLLFGVSMGLIVVFIFMFGFFNERIIAPLITPSKSVSNTPIIIDPNASANVGPEPKIIIPKINVEVPGVYNVPSNKESDVQKGLENGVVHYPSTPLPGQNGNAVFVGHSSGNVFNQGRYKFAFVLLNRMNEGDTFMIHYNGTRYVYKIYSRRIVKPTEVSVLGAADRQATATLITCDPPGSSANRLVLVAEQISPEVSKNSVAATAPVQAPAIVPGNSQSLFQRLFGWL